MTTEKDYASVKAKGTPYDSLIRQEADRNNIPYDYMHKLIYNESSFEPTAKSPKGPLGLGQFTELTGKAYGLMTPEDRMDPQKAVPAIARHLKDLSGAYPSTGNPGCYVPDRLCNESRWLSFQTILAIGGYLCVGHSLFLSQWRR